MVAGNLKGLASRPKGRPQAVDFLPQRGPRLLLWPMAPQSVSYPAAQCWPRSRQRRNGKQRACLAPRRQDVRVGKSPGIHMSHQPQPEQWALLGRCLENRLRQAAGGHVGYMAVFIARVSNGCLVHR
jgi:hypothetical protein